MGRPSLAATANAAVSTRLSLRMQQKTSKLFPVIVVGLPGYDTSRMPPPGSVAGLQRRQRDDDRDTVCHPYTIRDHENPGGGFGYCHPRTIGAAEILVGMRVVFLSVLLLCQGYWWAVSLFVAAAMPFWAGRDILQSSARS
jgi:hypothetical protein